MELEKEEVPVKIFIRDIWKLQQYDVDPNYFRFYDKYIRKVDIMGIVTEVRKNGDHHIYRVDDGTGTVICSFNHSNTRHLNELHEIEQLQESIAEMNFGNASAEGAAMEFLLEEAFNANQISFRPLEQGDCVHLQGFVKNFHDKREVTAYRLHKVPSSAHEVDRVFELSFLYSNCYAKDVPES
ncbi:CST complex subunit STN1-like [Thrips palmi]|uniref:CST complex subunit STN1-like n=1 Tax=Thrips palmi TaxID=161013 RepID=A0A6P8ZQH4_THRPL|nr:CST complex subunit STN1-like [Thrips palmi]XP_034245859.1 CST complex subunit STN1-like [Thrips palmi]XP_034245860.1 CST complex subunit STN1-like [Thrips palmi]